MLEEDKKSGTLDYQRLTEEEMKKRGILGRLVGNVADFINPTRNGRKYNEELWEKVFEDPIMQEKFKNKVMYGELGHPADRQEVDMEKVAVCMAEPPKKDKDGKLKAVFDILSTPNGRILKTLCDYGSTLGISSRGTGDIIQDDSGEDMVDPDSYDCECWDVVLVPAVEAARLQYTNESLPAKPETRMPNLVKALCEDLNQAKPDERKVMEETLQTLNINVEDNKLDSNSAKSKNILTESKVSETNPDNTEEAKNDGSDELIKSLQEALKAKTELETKELALQEQLAVSNTKVDQLTEELGKFKSTTVRLSSLVEKNKEKASKVSDLEEQLKVKEQTIDALTQENKKLVESKKSSKVELTESISAKDTQLASLNEDLEAKKKETKELTETLEKEKTDLTSKLEESESKLSKLTAIKENYKKLAINTADRYIKSKAVMLGITTEEIKNKLPESYTIDDVDSVCESLQDYALNINKLPFSFDRKVKVKVNESKEPSILPKSNIADDDDVSDNLLRISGLK